MSPPTSPFYYGKCCCCINLRTGCLIMGLLGLIVIIVTIIIIAIGLGAVIALSEPTYPMAIAIRCVLLFFLILALGFNIALLIGLHENKPGHIKAYLIYNTIFLIIDATLSIVSISAGIIDILIVVSAFVQILVSIYFSRHQMLLS